MSSMTASLRKIFTRSDANLLALASPTNLRRLDARNLRSLKRRLQRMKNRYATLQDRQLAARRRSVVKEVYRRLDARLRELRRASRRKAAVGKKAPSLRTRGRVFSRRRRQGRRRV